MIFGYQLSNNGYPKINLIYGYPKIDLWISKTRFLDKYNSIFGYPLFDFWISIIRFLDIQYSALFMNIQNRLANLQTHKLADSQTRNSQLAHYPHSCNGGLGNMRAASQRTHSLLSFAQKLWAKRTRHLSELDNRAAERQNKQNDMHV